MLCAEGRLVHRVAACSPGASAQGEDCPALKVWVPPGSSTVLDSAERVMPWDALDSGFAPHLL